MIVVSRKGIKKLSEIEIDTDKDWNTRSVINLGDVSLGDMKHLRLGNAIDFTTNGSFGSLTVNDRFRLFVRDLLEIGAGGNLVFSAGSFSFFTEFGNYLFKGNGENLFRIEDLNDTEWHIVDSIYEDSNVKVSGTRWAFKYGEIDYHIGTGVTLDKSDNGMMLGMVGNASFGLYSPLPHATRQGLEFSINPSDYTVTHIVGRIIQSGYIAFVDNTVPIPEYNEPLDDTKPYFAIYPQMPPISWIQNYNMLVLNLSQTQYAKIELDNPEPGMGWKKTSILLYANNTNFISMSASEGWSQWYLADATGYISISSVSYGSNKRIIMVLPSASGGGIDLSIYSSQTYIRIGNISFTTYDKENLYIGSTGQTVNFNASLKAPGGFYARIIDSDTEPSLNPGEMAFWYDTVNTKMYIIVNRNGVNYKIQLT